jgi:hypothetical protein
LIRPHSSPSSFPASLAPWLLQCCTWEWHHDDITLNAADSLADPPSAALRTPPSSLMFTCPHTSSSRAAARFCMEKRMATDVEQQRAARAPGAPESANKVHRARKTARTHTSRARKVRPESFTTDVNGLGVAKPCAQHGVLSTTPCQRPADPSSRVTKVSP